MQNQAPGEGACLLGSVGVLNPEAWCQRRPQDVSRWLAQIRGLGQTI